MGSGYLSGRGAREVERVERETEKRIERVEVRSSGGSTSGPTTSPTTSAPTQAPRRRLEVPDMPEVPLPDDAGKATDDVKDMADDAVGNLEELIP